MKTQFADIIVKSDSSGRLVRLKDVAKIELGALSYDQTCTLDSKAVGRPIDLSAARLQRLANGQDHQRQDAGTAKAVSTRHGL